MASIQMNRGTKAEIDNTPITDGLISFDTDDNYIYLDNGDTREPFGGVKVIPNPEEEPTEILRNLQIAEDVYKISGGHEIENQSGTTLTQRDVMQFTGAYSHDDSTSEVTKVDIVREMTATQKDNLTNGEAEGFQWTTDENDDLPLTAEWVAYDNDTSVKEKIDEIDLREGGTITGNLNVIGGMGVNAKNGTTSAVGESYLTVGNNIAEGTAENSRGRLRLYSNNSYRLDLMPPANISGNRQIWFPDTTNNSEIVALRSDAYKELVKLTPTTNETNSQLLLRFQTALAEIGSHSKRMGIIVFTVDGNAKIFHCGRFTSNNYMSYSCTYPSASAISVYNISYGGSDSVSFYNLIQSADGFTRTNLGRNVAEGSISLISFVE